MSIHTFTTLTHTESPKYIAIRVTLDSYCSYQDGHILFDEIQRECLNHISGPEVLESRLKSFISKMLPEKEVSIKGGLTDSKEQTIYEKIDILPSGIYAIGGKIYRSVEPKVYEIRISMHGDAPKA